MRDISGARTLYRPDPVPTDANLLQGYLSREFDKIANIVNAAMKLEKLYAEPAKPRDGDLARADGTSWDPGSGAGVYWYDGDTASWVFLG